MGTSLHLFMECLEEDGWEYIETNISHPGGYSMMGCLFGWRNYCNYEPIAGQRRLPNDGSDDREPLREAPWDCSWIGLWGINRIDWNETAREIDSRTSFYDADGKYVKKVAGFSLPVEQEETDSV